MSDASSVVRALLIYGICLPLAVFLGYLLAMPLDMPSTVMFGVLFAVLMIPILLRWHHVWLVAFWNANMLAFFVKGKPDFSLLLCVISLSISILQHILNKRIKFLSGPAIARPLLFLSVVVLATARLRGGIGLQIAGGESFGGKRYLLALGAVIGFFALTARQIPFKKVRLYVSLYYLGGLTGIMANLAGVLGPGLYFLYLIFPVDPASLAGGQNVTGNESLGRLAGLGMAAVAMSMWMLAMYGVAGIFQKFWRIGFLGLSFGAAMFGGYRGNLIFAGMVFCILFYLEGMIRSRLLPVLVLIAILVGSVVVGFSDRLPYPVQRTLSFLPVRVDPSVAADVKDSTDWRVDMWKEVIPDIPKYLILGKGYTFDPAEMQMIQAGMTKGEDGAVGSALAGDYHSGPLSVIIPLGIWGVIGFLWLIGAGIKVLLQNCRYGDPSLAVYNRFFLAQFIAKAIFFLGIFGSFYSDLTYFTGILGLSICINGGARKPVPAPVKRPVVKAPRLEPRSVGSF